MARTAIECPLLISEVLGLVRGVVEGDPCSSFVWPRAKIGMVGGKALKLLLMTRLAAGVVDGREVTVRAAVFVMAGGASGISWRRNKKGTQYPGKTFTWVIVAAGSRNRGERFGGQIMRDLR
jgi:hypothetical protein